MSQIGYDLNNKEIVSRALDVTTTAMQSKISTAMLYKYGQSWWNTQIVKNKVDLGIQRDIKEVDYADEDMIRSCLDTQLCCKIVERNPELFNGGKSLKKHAKEVRKIRNERSHTGDQSFNAEDAHEYLETLIDFNDEMNLDIGDELEKLAETIKDEKPKKSLFIDNSPLIEEKQENSVETITVCNKIPRINEGICDICIKSTSGFLSAITDRQLEKDDISRNVVKVKHTKKGDVYLLKLDEKFTVDDSTGIIVDGKEYPSYAATFQGFDYLNKTVRMYPEKDLDDAIKDDSNIQLFSDMTWLIRNTGHFYEIYGNYISFPKKPQPFSADAILSKGLDNITKDQLEAVKLVMKEPLSYVWGVPGSGKTRYVLAKAINECVRRNERVLIIAPTNYALEQVIIGLISAFKDDKGCQVNPERDLIRIGTPTSEFLGEYQYVCEEKSIQPVLHQYRQSLSNIRIAIADKRYTELKSVLDEAFKFANGAGKIGSGSAKLVSMMSSLTKAIRSDPRYSIIASDVNEHNIREFMDNVKRIIYSEDRVTDSELGRLSIDELVSKENNVHNKILKFEKENPKSDINSCRVIAMTMSKFLISYGPEFYEKRMKLDVDHVFIDEAGYCSCIQALALFSLGAPITMLGDHMQLPPVCEIDSGKMNENMTVDGHRFDYLWDMSALYVDTLFSDNIMLSSKLYESGEEPTFEYTSVARLVTTHRFGQNLATILGDMIYGLKLKSGNPNALEVVVLDAHIDSFPKRYNKTLRENIKEAERVVEYAKSIKNGNFVILTPYKDQMRCIKRLDDSLSNHIITIHKSQGKEWDTVIISVCDGRACNEDKPPRFTSTADAKLKGKKVINTALSRAKKRLVVVCDTEYWAAKPNELIGKIVQSYKK